MLSMIRSDAVDGFDRHQRPTAASESHQRLRARCRRDARPAAFL
jgi:hypothetical protein